MEVGRRRCCGPGWIASRLAVCSGVAASLPGALPLWRWSAARHRPPTAPALSRDDPRFVWDSLHGNRDRARPFAHRGALRAARRRLQARRLRAGRSAGAKDVARIERHPEFDLNACFAHLATADVALLKLAAPLPARSAGPARRRQPKQSRPAMRSWSRATASPSAATAGPAAPSARPRSS